MLRRNSIQEGAGRRNEVNAATDAAAAAVVHVCRRQPITPHGHPL